MIEECIKKNPVFTVEKKEIPSFFRYVDISELFCRDFQVFLVIGCRLHISCSGSLKISL